MVWIKDEILSKRSETKRLQKMRKTAAKIEALSEGRGSRRVERNGQEQRERKVEK